MSVFFALAPNSPNNSSFSASSGTSSITPVVKKSNAVPKQPNYLVHTESFDHEEIPGPMEPLKRIKIEPEYLTGIIPTRPTVIQSAIQPKISSSPSSLTSVLGELHSKMEEVGKISLEKDKICKRAPLLHGLLDKGKVSFAKNSQSFSGIQNGNKTVSSVLEINSEEKSSVIDASAISPTRVTTPVTSNEQRPMGIYTDCTNLSGTIEVQPGQGVVRLHTENPEKSNQGSDSSLFTTAQTLQFASKVISRTTVNSQVPFVGNYEIITAITAIATSARREPSQQILTTAVLNELNQIKHVLDKTVHQHTVGTQTTSSNTSGKKPPSNSQKLSPPKATKPGIETTTPLLEATTQTTGSPGLTNKNVEQCCICDQVFVSETDLVDHLIGHTEEDVWKEALQEEHQLDKRNDGKIRGKK